MAAGFVLLGGGSLQKVAAQKSQSSSPAVSAWAEQITTEHNVLRKKNNVPPLVWDGTLARTAQAWAETIALRAVTPPEHNNDESMGENILWGGAGAFTPTFMVDHWWKESDNYNAENNTCAEGKTCSHFTHHQTRLRQSYDC